MFDLIWYLTHTELRTRSGPVMWGNEWSTSQHVPQTIRGACMAHDEQKVSSLPLVSVIAAAGEHQPFHLQEVRKVTLISSVSRSPLRF